ncbi:hypothetical protein [Kribbella sp. ALI-6-A]|uniref:hypothetical protein n=1 Tax=Kribbella sp. ALI-6-A TaxID=1933817 RepID=UPI00117BB8BA|nr:hypothetical protein [Kribbella sp. ALI-6-A]
MKRIGVVAAAVAATAVLVIGVGVQAVGGRGSAGAYVAPPSAEPVADPAAPGWRWESYGTVKVQVPDSWADSVYSGLWTCGDRFRPDGSTRTPMVGRPWRGPVQTIACLSVPRLAERIPHLWFDDSDAKPGITRFDHGWATEVRVVAGVPLAVFSNDAAMRRRILDSAKRMDGTDPNGCSVARPAVLGDGQRPTGPGLAAIGEVKSIRVCVYSYQLPGNPSVFQAGLQISGDTARQLGDALRAAPAGVGPVMSSSNCEQPRSRDDLLLTVAGENGDQAVVVRYATCRSNGTDDGTTLRRLTTDTLVPLSKVLYAEIPVLPILRDLAGR